MTISLYNNSNPTPLSVPACPPGAVPPTGGGGGKLLGIWRLGELLHQGTHSQLWSAQPADAAGSPRWDYALKSAAPQQPTPADREASVQRLHRHAKAAAIVQHPQLVAVLDAAPEAAEPFLVMPRLSGQSLTTLIASGTPQPLPVVLWFVRQIAQAGAALHQAGLAHGEITPDNILISPQGQATLLDLGAACWGESADAAKADDIFSLGRLLWQLLPLATQQASHDESVDRTADLIADLLHAGSASRPSAEQVVAQLMKLELATLGCHIAPSEQPAIRRAA